MTARNSTKGSCICKNCGVEFFVSLSDIKRGRGNYCKHACYTATIPKIIGPRHPFPDRFWSRVLKTESCWIWTGAKDEDGYGMARHTVKRKSMKAHRLAWEVTFGEIPDDLWVLHDCPGGDNRSCVNPEHLWLGTVVDNNRDRDEKGMTAHNYGERSGAAKLTAEKVRQIRQLYSTGNFVMKELADEFGISESNIGLIASGKTWSHIT